jgi:hypothetical protein
VQSGGLALPVSHNAARFMNYQQIGRLIDVTMP